MKLNWKINSLGALVFTLLWISCTVTPIENPVVVNPDEFEGICFETEILPLLVSNCGNSGCHNAIDREDGIDLTSYENILKEVKPGDPDDSELIESMRESDLDDIMPPPPASPMSEEQIALVEQWIKDGAENTTSCTPTECDLDKEFSYSGDILPIIDLYCLGCHSTNDPQGGYSYTEYSETMKSVNDGTLMGSIRFEDGFVSMPDKSNKMPDCYIETIQTWIDQGAKDN